MRKNDRHITDMTFRSMPTEPKTYNAETHSVRAIVATETPVRVANYEEWRMENEVLLMSGFTLPEGRDQVPLLDSHQRYSIDDMLGSLRGFQPIDGKLWADLHFSTTEDGQKAETMVKEGHLTDISGGYRTLESTWIPEGQKGTVQGRTYEGPIRITTKWMLKEASLTPIGADVFAQTRSGVITAEVRRMLEERGLAEGATEREAQEFLRSQLTPSPTQTKGSNMKTKEELEAERPASEEQARKDLVLQQRADQEAADRVSSIYDIAARNEGRVANISELRDKAVKERWTADKFAREVLTAIPATQAAPAGPPADQVRISMNDVIAPWRKRAVASLNYMHARATGSDRIEGFSQRLKELTGQVTDQMRQAEMREFIEKIDKAQIAPMQKVRLMSSLTDAAGNYTLPAPFLAEVFVIVEERGVARREFRPMPMGSKTLDMSTIATKAIAYWTAQGSNVTPADLAFGTGQLLAAKLAAITSWSSELEEDTAIAFLQVVTESIAEAIYTKEDSAGFAGDGSAGHGSFTGLLNAATAGYTMATGKSAFTDADADDYRAVRDSVSLARRRGAKWFLHPDLISGLEDMKDTQGRYIYRGPGDNRPALLWGYPIANNGEGVESMPAASDSAVSTKFAAFGNPRHMIMGMRRELEFAVSREAIIDNGTDVTYNAFQGDGTILKATERIAFKLVLANSIAFLKTAAS